MDPCTRDVPASLESLLPFSLHTLPSFLMPSMLTASPRQQQTLTSPPQMTPSPITHPPSLVASLIPLFNLTNTSRFLDSNNNTTSPSSPAHLAAAATSPTTTSLAHSLALSHQRRKEDTAARPTASRWHMNTNPLLQTSRVVRSASLRELLNATSDSKIQHPTYWSFYLQSRNTSDNRSNPFPGRHLPSQNKKFTLLTWV